MKDVIKRMKMPLPCGHEFQKDSDPVPVVSFHPNQLFYPATE